ncbi:MAG: hypothetical protein ACI97A_003297 [Planctomycetota bacterium]
MDRATGLDLREAQALGHASAKAKLADLEFMKKKGCFSLHLAMNVYVRPGNVTRDVTAVRTNIEEAILKIVYHSVFTFLLCIVSFAQNPFLTTTYIDDLPTGMALQAIKNIGDVNADGIDDYAISTFDTNAAAMATTGVVTVYSGANNSVLHQFTSSVPGERFGFSLAAGGDINNDGFGDVLVGAVLGTTGGPVFQPGRVVAYSGSDGSLIHSVDGLGTQASFGFSIASLGDINGDGHADYVAGAPNFQGASFTVGGYARVISGIDGAELYIFTGPPGSSAGRSVDNAGDIDGDGISDIAISQPSFAFPGQPAIGRVRIRSGANGTVLHAVFGTTSVVTSDWTVRGVGDLDGDGINDFAIGQPLYVNPANGTFGRIRIYSGATNTPFMSITSNLSTTDYAYFGRYFEVVGDINGDGVNDIATTSGLGNFSRALIFSGANGAALKSFPPAPGGFVQRICPLGDQNNDGIQEIGVFSSAVASATVFSAIDDSPEIRIYTSGTKPIEAFVSSAGPSPTLTLSWTPEAGDLHDVKGRLRSTGATPGGEGRVLVSFAPADIPVFGTSLLVAVDPTNLILVANIVANSAGHFVVSNITRRIPEIAGFSTYVQFYEVSPVVRASRGVHFVAIP